MNEYVYDNTFDGLLTAIFYAYTEKGTVKITKEIDYRLNLLFEKVNVTTQQDKANRVYNGLYSKLSYSALSNVYYLYLCDEPDMDTLIFNYIKLCFKYSDSINLAKNNDIISAVDKYARRVTIEAHRFHGFVRFKQIAPLIFYAQIEPDHNILPLIMEPFRERFSDQHFIIHDLKRKYAIVYDLKSAYLKDLSLEEGQKLSALTDGDSFEVLFKSFYQAATVEERLNERQRRSYMPIRYWKHLVEI